MIGHSLMCVIIHRMSMNNHRRVLVERRARKNGEKGKKSAKKSAEKAKKSKKSKGDAAGTSKARRPTVEQRDQEVKFHRKGLRLGPIIIGPSLM